jgi:hypothetical protein
MRGIFMRCFVLNRTSDETGVSGTGIVAEGVQFEVGKCVVCWRPPTSSVTVYDSIDDVRAIHCHGDRTRIEWTKSSD